VELPQGNRTDAATIRPINYSLRFGWMAHFRCRHSGARV
jgi:hypothetical protein